MPPKNPNIYTALLKGLHLDYLEAMIWEAHVKTCHMYAKFGCHYSQMVRFLLAKDGDENTLFHNFYLHE
jgi:hypothetical protein